MFFFAGAKRSSIVEVTRIGWSALYWCSLALTITGCQPERPVVSLDEAKKITAKYQGRTFAVPPRTIDSVVAEIESYNGPLTRELQEIQARAAQPDRELENPDEYVKFLVNRGVARQYLGDLGAAKADFVKAGGIASVSDYWRYEALKNLSYVEDLASELNSSVETGLRALEIADRGQYGGQFHLRYRLADGYARLGKLENAESVLRRGLDIYSFAHTRKSWGTYRVNWEVLAARAKAHDLQRRGRWVDAEAEWRKAEEHLKGNWGNDQMTLVYNSGLTSMIPRALTYNLIAQGRFTEAEIAARRAITAASNTFGKHSPQSALGLRALADVLATQGHYEDSFRLLALSEKVLLKSGHPTHSILINRVRASKGAALVRFENWSGAATELQKIRDSLTHRNEAAKTLLGTNLDAAIAFIMTGRTGDASSIVDATLLRRAALRGKDHVSYFEAMAIRGMTRVAAGQNNVAWADFEVAFAGLLNQVKTLTPARRHRIQIAFESYLKSLSSTKARDESSKALSELRFQTANLVMAGRGQRAASYAASRSNLGTPELADAARREQDAVRQIEAMRKIAMGLTEAVPSSSREQPYFKEIFQEIDRLTAARDAIRAELDRRAPKYGQLIHPEVQKVRDIQQYLRADEAIVSVFVGTDETWIWAFARNGGLFEAKVSAGRKEVGKLISRIRSSISPTDSTLGALPPFDNAAAYELFRLLLLPLRQVWNEKAVIVFAGSGTLGQIPLGILLKEPVATFADREVLFDRYRTMPWLIRSHAIVSVPSLSALVALRQNRNAPEIRTAFAGFGDPVFSDSGENSNQALRAFTKTRTVGGQIALRNVRNRNGNTIENAARTSVRLSDLERLPETSREIMNVAELLGASVRGDVFLREKATEQQIKSMNLSNRHIIAFATHGLVAGDIDGLHEPALALSSPEVTRTEGDGLLTATEIFGLRLNADWVVLSACNTAAADGKGLDAVYDLSQAFFYAGSRSVLVTHWPVETTSAEKFTTTLFTAYTRNKTATRAQAVRSAQLALIDRENMTDQISEKVVASYAHPLFWAPFAVIGDGGATNQ